MAVDHRCLGCGRIHQDAREVTLHDGTVVSSYSEAWRMECEARAVLRMPSRQQRQQYLFGKTDRFGKRQGGVEQRRGKQAADRLADLVSRLWDKKHRWAAVNDNAAAQSRPFAKIASDGKPSLV